MGELVSADEAERGAVAGRPSVGRLVNGKTVFLGAALAAALGFFIWTSTQGAVVYFHTVGELRAMGSEAIDRLVRVNGVVTEGSIDVHDDGRVIEFSIHDATGDLPVSYRGTPPDLFGYSTEDRYSDVIVEGQLGPDGVFTARNLIVKHGPEFEAREIPAQ